MKKIALFSIVALSALMVGCSSTQTRDCDDNACGTAQCADAANCESSTCEKASCEKKACPADCAKACCADKAACTHPNTTFSCPNCKDGKACCADCAVKAAAACPDCMKG